MPEFQTVTRTIAMSRRQRFLVLDSPLSEPRSRVAPAARDHRLAVVAAWSRRNPAALPRDGGHVPMPSSGLTERTWPAAPERGHGEAPSVSQRRAISALL